MVLDCTPQELPAPVWCARAHFEWNMNPCLMNFGDAVLYGLGSFRPTSGNGLLAPLSSSASDSGPPADSLLGTQDLLWSFG